MKKLFTNIFLSVAVIISAVPSVAAAEKTGYTYTIINNTATITGFSGEPVFIDIPDTVEGCKVTEIRDNAFYECSTLRNITIPDTVEKIGHHAFYACSALESIVIPDSVTEIGMGCFCGDSALTSATVSDNISLLPESCFRSCTSLRSITIPENITDIGDFCFSGCTSLSAVSLGEKTGTIGDCAFYMCSSMSGIYIPPSVKEIGFCALGFIPTADGASKLDDFTIFGAKKSVAEKYADENNFTFENASDSVHAFAIKRISGQRIDIPSVTLIGGAVLIVILMIFACHKKSRRK
ncbi:MAG: leucine-rich repeat domain-containing protein [Ruminococcus flavefaciens]|nr:leucine-rich repeat domain-containing protein [Ruminococcus flavefaciens]MCM1230551.1 leucine-rich repeat domain-containing protein [Ruminococcus flavefaciens]